jgi:hypothetical protein
VNCNRRHFYALILFHIVIAVERGKNWNFAVFKDIGRGEFHDRVHMHVHVRENEVIALVKLTRNRQRTQQKRRINSLKKRVEKNHCPIIKCCVILATKSGKTINL